MKIIKLIFRRKKEIIEDYDFSEIKRKNDSLEFWTPELIEWIGQTNDAVKLAVASCLVNTHEWPAWLPGRPPNYDKKSESVELFYIVEVYRILKEKSESISPGLYDYIWLTNYYRNDQ